VVVLFGLKALSQITDAGRTQKPDEYVPLPEHTKRETHLSFYYSVTVIVALVRETS
jgi:hypothetical protein